MSILCGVSINLENIQFRTMELPCNQVLLWQQSGLNQQSPNTAIVNYYQVRVCPGSHDSMLCLVLP